MARPRKVPAADLVNKRPGEPDTRKPGTYVARRARAAMRGGRPPLDASPHLTPEQTRDAMRLTEEQLKTLDAIAAGLPVRNAREAVAAIRLKMEFGLQKPTVPWDARVGIVVMNPFQERPALTQGAAQLLLDSQASQGQDLAIEDEDKDP